MHPAELIVVGLIVIFVARRVIPRLGGWNRAFDVVSKRYNAQVIRGYLFARPTMTFNYGRSFCRVRTRRSNRFAEKKQTDVELTWPDRTFRLVISTEPAISTRIRPRFGIAFRRKAIQVEVGDSGFSSRFSVRSDKPELTRTFLTPQVQWQIEQLRVHLGNEHLVIEIAGGLFTVSKPGFIRHPVLLDDYIRYSLELFDRMFLSQCEGIEFINDETATIVEECICPICSEQIETQLVTCVRCKTPHCLDCWQYNGQCATFACKETRFVRAGKSTAEA